MISYILHFVRLCVIGLTSDHPLLNLSDNDRCVKLEYSMSLKQPISGKRKRGAPFVESSTILCNIYTERGARYRIDCCVRGHLIEMAKDQEVLESLGKTSSFVYLAIIKPKLTEVKQCVQHLIPRNR
jgi:hypothetical protein